MSLAATLKWIGLALLGLLVAVAVAFAAARLASREIGLASEPITAGEELAPRIRRPTPPQTTTQPNPKPSPAPESQPTTPVPPGGEETHEEDHADGDSDD